MWRPVVLREQSRLYRQAATKEVALEIRHRLANHALALHLLAERIEREMVPTIAQRQARRSSQRQDDAVVSAWTTIADTATALLSHPKTNERASLSDVLGGVAAGQMMMADKVSRVDVERLIEQTKRHRDKNKFTPCQQVIFTQLK
jgi:hypothetical protein